MALTLDSLDKLLSGARDTLMALKGIDSYNCDGPELDEVWNTPVKFSRYKTEQVVDRIVIQVRGESGVTIHTADAGQGDKQ